MGRKKTIEEEIAGFLDALGHQAGEMPAVLAAAQKGIQHHTFAPYHALQEKVREHEALIAIIESRIERMRGKCPAELEQDLKTAEMIVMEVMEKAPCLVDLGDDDGRPADNPPPPPETAA